MNENAGVVTGGPYSGQEWSYPMQISFPRWVSVMLFDGKEFHRRDVPEKYLEISVSI